MDWSHHGAWWDWRQLDQRLIAELIVYWYWSPNHQSMKAGQWRPD